MENLVEIFANTLDAILGIVFLTMILGKKKSMSNWLFVVLALIVPVANVVLQKVFPDSPERIILSIFYLPYSLVLYARMEKSQRRSSMSQSGISCLWHVD